MSIFKGLASRRAEAQKSAEETADTSLEGKLVKMHEHPKAQPSGGDAQETSAANLFAEDNDLDSAPAAPASKSMWDLVDDTDDDAAADTTPAPSVKPAEARAPATQDAPQSGAPESAPAQQQPNRRAGGRVKTRLLGFDHSNGSMEEIGSRAKSLPDVVTFPVGWLVVAKGPGRGTAFPLSHGVSHIGRGEDQDVTLDFGDTAISREGHAIIAYDDENRSFFLGHGGKSNLVRLNGKPVLATESVKQGDMVRVGETTLMLVTVCGESFSWTEEGDE